MQDAFCQDIHGAWRPLQGQVSADGRVSILGFFAELHGTVQLLDAAANPLCSLAALNYRWSCTSWCNWAPGNGDMKLTVGWQAFGLDPSMTETLLSDPFSCQVQREWPALQLQLCTGPGIPYTNLTCCSCPILCCS